MASAVGGDSEHEDEIETKREQREDEGVLGKEKVSTSPNTDDSLRKYIALLFLKLVSDTEEFYMDRNIEDIGMFSDIVYQYKHQNSDSYTTHFIKFVSTDQYEFNLFEAYLSYVAVKQKPKYNEMLSGKEFHKFALVITNKCVLERFHVHACLDVGADKSFSLMTFNTKFVSILKKDTYVLKAYRTSLCFVLQSLEVNNIEVATAMLNDIKKKLNTQYLKEILSPEYYEDDEQFIIILRNIVQAMRDEIDWKSFCLNFTIYALEEMCTTTFITTLLRKQLWHMYGFPLMTTDTIISELMFTFFCNGDHHCDRISHMNLQFWYQTIREYSHNAFSAVRNRHITVLRNVRYKKCVIDTLESVIHEQQVVHIVPPAGKSNKLTLWKIAQLLMERSHFFMDNEVLKLHWREVSHLWLASDIAVLIATADSWDEQTIINFLNERHTKKLIVVSKDCQQTKMLAYYLRHKYTRFEDNLNVDQLIDCLFFNSRSFKLNGAPMYKAFKKQKEVRAMALQETFEELLNYGNLKAFCDEVGDTSYTVFRYHFIHKEVIFEKGHIFCIKGNVKQLRCLKPFQKKNFEEGASITLPCKEVKDRKHFVALSNKYSNVHWLQLNKHHLVWLASKGNMEVIRKHIIDTAPTFYSILKEYCFEDEPPGRIILLIDDCDSGLLDSIIKCKTKLIPKYFTLSVKLLDFVPFLKKPDVTFEDLIEKSPCTNLHKKIFKYALEQTDRAEMFLNGCGSAFPVYHEKMVEFINNLLQNTRVGKVWITADRKRKQMLESSFSTLAFTKTEGELEKCRILKAPDIAIEVNQEDRGNKQLFDVKYSGRLCTASRLHVACQCGDLNQVKHLILQENVDIDATDSIFLQTPLMWAAKLGKEEIIDFLVQKGAKTALYDKQGVSVIHLAATSGNTGTVRSLMCVANMDINTVDDLKRTPLMWAVINSDLNMVRYLIKNGASPLCRDVFNYNLLMLAAERGFLPMIEFLLLQKETKAFINSHNSKRKTPLILAVQNNFITAAIMLLKHGAKVALQDDCGQTSFHVALRQGNTRMFKMLFEWSSDHCIAITDRQGKTILHLAAKYGNIEAFRCLDKYQCNASICNVPCKVWKNVALHYAAKQGHLEITKWLIKHGSEVDAFDRKKFTPLHWASENGHSNVVQCLLDYGANANQWNYRFQTPLFIAAMNGHADIVLKLWFYGADIETSDYKNQTPLMRAKQNKCKSVLSLLK